MSGLAFSSSKRTEALGEVVEEFYSKVLFDEEPLFVSDEATVWDIWSGDEEEILARCSNYYGVPVSREETRQPFWKFVTSLDARRGRRGSASIQDQLHRELWTSWASLLRSYSAAHGLNSRHHAVVEVGADEITLRVASRWLRFTHSQVEDSEGNRSGFSLEEDGTVKLGETTQEMDLAAEQWAREMMHSE
jgi:hypothetical protein